MPTIPRPRLPPYLHIATHAWTCDRIAKIAGFVFGAQSLKIEDGIGVGTRGVDVADVLAGIEVQRILVEVVGGCLGVEVGDERGPGRDQGCEAGAWWWRG